MATLEQSHASNFPFPEIFPKVDFQKNWGVGSITLLYDHVKQYARGGGEGLSLPMSQTHPTAGSKSPSTTNLACMLTSGDNAGNIG